MGITEDLEDEYVLGNNWYETAELRQKAAVEQFPFQYEESSSPSHLRLLKLTSRKVEEELFCSLQQFEIDASPHYEALSYTWGNAESTDVLPSRDASLKDSPHQVMYIHASPSLINILSRLGDSEDDMWLWVDALCINQISDDERNQQVKLMDAIFGKAFKLVACLDSGELSPQPERDALTPFGFVRKAMHCLDNEDAATSLARYCRSISPSAENWGDRNRRGTDPMWLIQLAVLFRNASATVLG